MEERSHGGTKRRQGERGRNQRGREELRRTRDGEREDVATVSEEEKKRRTAGRKCAAVSCRSPGSNTGQVGGFWVTAGAGVVGKLRPGGPFAAG